MSLCSPVENTNKWVVQDLLCNFWTGMAPKLYIITVCACRHLGFWGTLFVPPCSCSNCATFTDVLHKWLNIEVENLLEQLPGWAGVVVLGKPYNPEESHVGRADNRIDLFALDVTKTNIQDHINASSNHNPSQREAVDRDRLRLCSYLYTFKTRVFWLGF